MRPSFTTPARRKSWNQCSPLLIAHPHWEQSGLPPKIISAVVAQVAQSDCSTQVPVPIGVTPWATEWGFARDFDRAVSPTWEYSVRQPRSSHSRARQTPEPLKRAAGGTYFTVGARLSGYVTRRSSGPVLHDGRYRPVRRTAAYQLLPRLSQRAQSVSSDRAS